MKDDVATRIIKKTLPIKMKEDVGMSQKACEQVQVVNIGPKIKQTTST